MSRKIMLFALALSVVMTCKARAAHVRPPEEPSGLEYFSKIHEAVDKAAPGDEISIAPGKYREDIEISVPDLTLFSYPAGDARIHGTIRLRAPGISLVNLTVIDQDACVIIEPEAADCKLSFNRLVVTSESGVALEVAATETGGIAIFENLIYTPGGLNPDIDHRGVKYNYKRFERAGTGILVHGGQQSQHTDLRIHHNRISGYRIGLSLGADDNDCAVPLQAQVWKNQITANTVGIKVFSVDCNGEDTEVSRNTGTGVIAFGKDNSFVGNRICDNARWGMEAQDARIHNNIIVRNRRGAVRATGNSQVAHNTFYGNGGFLLSTRARDAGSAEATVLFINNLIDHRGTLFQISGNLQRHHNVYANHAAPKETEEGQRKGKVAYHDLARDDFRPLRASIAIDAAVPLPGLSRDASNSGRRIGLAADAGAYEVGPKVAEGRSWWVAPDGDDTAGDGSLARPFRSVGRAAAEAGPDDLVYLRAGTYTGDSTIRCAGAEGHPVRIMPAPGVPQGLDLVKSFVAHQTIELVEPEQGKVVLRESCWHLQNAVYVSIEGLVFQDSPHFTIIIGEQASHNTIRNYLFLNCPVSGDARTHHGCIEGTGPEANDVLIENNVFDRRPNNDWIYRECDAIHPVEDTWCKRWTIQGNRIAGYEKLQLGRGGVIGNPPTYHLTENNEFFECNRAMHIKSSDNIFRYNYVHDLVPGYTREPVGMMNRGGHRNIYEGNRVEGCPYAGMLVLDSDNIVRNNIFDRCGTGVIVAYKEFGARPAKNTSVFHNTFVNNNRAVHVDPMCSAMVYNNIIYNSTDVFKLPPVEPAMVADGSGIYPLEKLDWPLFRRFQYQEPGVLRAGHNLYWNAEPAYMRNYEGGSYDIYADPMFVDAAKGDYHLQPSSPARRVGRSLGVGQDFEGNPRPLDAPDCGALQCQAQ